MIEFLSANMGTIIVLAILAVIIGSIIGKLRRDKTAGRSSCGCDCSTCGCGCSNSGMCHGNRTAKSEKTVKNSTV